MQGKYFQNKFLVANSLNFRNLAIGIGIQNFPEGRIIQKIRL
jgi:hypothetical protein